jgi:hypothetical protein
MQVTNGRILDPFAHGWQPGKKARNFYLVALTAGHLKQGVVEYT